MAPRRPTPGRRPVRNVAPTATAGPGPAGRLETMRGWRSRSVPAAAAVLVTLAAVLASCSTTPQPIPGQGSAEAPAPPPPPEPAPGQVAGVPIPDGQIDDAVARLDRIAHDVMAGSAVPGMAVAVVHGGKTVFAKGFGTRAAAAPPGEDSSQAGQPPAAAGKHPVDKNTVFPLGALSTPVSATAVATQLTEGRSWSTPVHELMPEFAASDPYITDHATLGDLFAGTLGFPADSGSHAARLGIDRQDLVGRLQAQSEVPFRTAASPDDVGPTLAGEAVARSAGTDWAGLADRSLFQPLSMSSTSARSADFASNTDRAVPQVESGGQYRAAGSRAWTDAVAPAVGITSSARDMAAWMQTVLAGGTRDGKHVIPEDPLVGALTSQAAASPSDMPDARPRSRGYGFDIAGSPAGRVMISARGGLPLSGNAADESGAENSETADATSGPDAALTLIPSADVGIVTLTNAISTPENQVVTAEIVNAQFADLVQFGSAQRDWTKWFTEQAAGGPSESASSPSTSPSAPDENPPALPSYDGVYTNALFGNATVRTSNDSMTLALGPAMTPFRLTRVSGNTFVMAPADPSSPSGAEFAAAHPDARASFDGDALTITYLDHDGNGVFRR